MNWTEVADILRSGGIDPEPPASTFATGQGHPHPGYRPSSSGRPSPGGRPSYASSVYDSPSTIESSGRTFWGTVGAFTVTIAGCAIVHKYGSASLQRSLAAPHGDPNSASAMQWDSAKQATLVTIGLSVVGGVVLWANNKRLDKLMPAPTSRGPA